MLRESLRKRKAGLQAEINQPNQRLQEVRLRLSRRITFGDRVQVVVDRKEAPGLRVTLDAMWDSLKEKSESHARGWVLLGHCQATVRVVEMTCKAPPITASGGARVVTMQRCIM